MGQEGWWPLNDPPRPSGGDGDGCLFWLIAIFIVGAIMKTLNSN